jgi:hypothetical protein
MASSSIFGYYPALSFVSKISLYHPTSARDGKEEYGRNAFDLVWTLEPLADAVRCILGDSIRI